MKIQVDTPAVLALLALLPLLCARRRGVGADRTALLAMLARGAAATAVIALLAGVRLERPRPEAGTCLIAAIDVSASVEDGAVARARDVLGHVLRRLGPDDVLGSLRFAARAHVVAHPRHDIRDLAALLPAPADDVSGVERNDSDLAAAFTLASSLCPAGKERALLLFSDGNETSGSLAAEVARTGAHVPVYAFPPRRSELPAAVIRRVLAPALAPERPVLPLEVVIESRRAAPFVADLRLRTNGVLLTRESVRLAPGLNVIALPYRLHGAGQYALDAELALPGDTAPLPGSGRATIAVTEPLRVLVVSERAASVVATALAERGMHVDTVSPRTLADRIDGLAEQHLVVFDDVARGELGDATLEALAAWVARGGGLIATGGEHLFGDAAYTGSAFERILPVSVRAQAASPQEREPIAIYLLIDRSNSMGYASREPTLHNGEKMAYAKRAALAVLDQLGDRDLVAAIAFDSQPYELGALLPAGECRAALAARIQQIQYGGGTDFKEALEIARRRLAASGRPVRHVILLTDGDSNRSAEDHAAVIAALARAEITVTSIRIGSDTVNLDLLDAISRATGGVFHHVEDVQQLPQLMIRDAQRLLGRASERREMPARAAAGGTILAGIPEQEVPAVSRWAVVEAKHGSEVRLFVEDGEARDPLLATWQYELGRVAAVPLDFQGGAASWAAWRGFAKLWTQLAEWTAARARAGDHRLAAARQRDGTRITLEAMADDAGPFMLRLDDTEDIVLRQVSPRGFAATVPNLRSGLHRAVLTGRGSAFTERFDLFVPASADGGRELRAVATNEALLTAAAAATGGAVDPDPARVLAARPGVRRETIPLDWLLAPLALLLVLGDVAIRRLLRP
ncbi:MAG: VWA domain-containing protein [Myxococcales bacterium]|jgi:Mg-chelatase subunit ChlD|nr:VWA domain-containing protein [Myxococcales bacterium]